MKKIIQLNRFMLLLVAMLTMSLTQVWAETATLTLSSTKKFGTSSGSTLKDNVDTVWTVTKTEGSGLIQNQYNSDYHGQQFGSKNGTMTAEFSASYGVGAVTSVKVDANTGGAASLSVKVGTVDFQCGEDASVSVKNNLKAGGPSWYEFTGSATGKIVITLKGTSKAAYFGGAVVTYSTKAPDPIKVSSIGFVNKFDTLDLGDAKKLDYTIAPNNADDKRVAFKSLNESALTITADGTITTKAPNAKVGVVVTALDSVNKGTKLTDTCYVTVVAYPVTKVQFTQKYDTLKVGDKLQLNYDLLPNNATDPRVQFESLNPSALAVDAKGVITGVDANDSVAVVITALDSINKGEKLTDTCYVFVAPVFPVESVKFNKTYDTIKVNQQQKLEYTLLPDNATDQRVKFESLNESALTIKEDGTITGLAANDSVAVVITALDSINKGDKLTDTCYITIVNVKVESVLFTAKRDTLEVGESHQLEWTINPEDATDPSVEFKSLNDSLAITQEGVITGKYANDSVAVVVIAKDSTNKEVKLSDTCYITIVAYPVTNVQFTQKYDTVKIGKTNELKYTLTPAEPTDSRVKFESLNPDALQVEENGKITGLAINDSVPVVIMALDSITRDSLTDTCYIAIVNVKVESVQFKIRKDTLEVGESLQLGWTINPEDATDPSVEFKSLNDSLAITQEGVITGKYANDSVAVVVIAKDSINKGEKLTDTCYITIVAYPVTNVQFAQKYDTVKIGKTKELKYTLTPAEPTDSRVKFESLNPTALQVEEDGTITGLAANEKVAVVITALDSISRDSLTDTCYVTVEAVLVESVKFTQASATLKVGETLQLQYTIAPDTAMDKRVAFKSLNESALKVDDKGKVTALAASEKVAVVVTALDSFQVGDKLTDTCYVTVITIPVTSVKFTTASATVEVGKKLKLQYTIAPENAMDQRVQFASMNTSALTVAGDGTVTGVAASEKVAVIITALDSFKIGAKLTDTCYVTVKEVVVPPTPTTGVYRLVTNATSLKVGDQLIIGAAVTKDEITSYYAAGAMGTTKYFGPKSATVTGDVIESKEAIIITLGGVKDAWTLTTSEGIVGTKAAKALVLNGKDATTTWKISIEDGNVKIESTKSELGKIMYNNSENSRFCNYTSAPSKTMLLPQLYRLTKSSSTPTKVSGVSFVNKLDTVEVGDVKSFEYIVLPDTATDQRVSFTSLDTAAIKINAKGQMVAVATNAKVAVVVTALDSLNKGTKLTDTCFVTVKDAQLKTCAEANAETQDGVVYKLNEVVTVCAIAQNLYIKDETGSTMVFIQDTVKGIKAGDRIANLQGTSKLYNGLMELIPSNEISSWTITEGEAPEIPVAEAAPTKEDMNTVMKWEDVVIEGKFTSRSKTSLTGMYGNDSISFRNNFKLTYTFEEGVTYNIVGAVAVYNSQVQVYFISAEESGETGLVEIMDKTQVRKMIYKGQVVVMKDGKMFNTLGQELDR